MQHTPSDPLPLDLDDVLGHVDWLRRLARALVRDEASADDLVQDAVGVAFAAKTPIRDLRGFLAGTVRRLASRGRRTAIRRERREQERAADVDLALPATDELAERVDTLRIVLEELRELPAAQQRVVSLRYLDDLDATEIARREGTSLSTVRSHLARGIAALRERLDRRAGGRDAWCAVLAPWVGIGVPIPAGPDSEIPVPEPTTALHAAGLTGAVVGATGVLAMIVKAITLSLVPLALAGVWYASGDHDVEIDATLARSAEADDGTRADLADVAPRADVPREALPVEVSSTTSGPAATSDDLKDGYARVEGQVIDALTGEPVPFLDLSIVEGEPDEHGSKHAASATTDAAGHFSSRFESQPVGVVGVTAFDDHGGVWRRPRIQRLKFPFEEPVEVRVGPTFRLGLPADLDLEARRFTVAFVTPKGTRRSSGIDAVVRGGGATGELPWVRFSTEVLEVEGDGPWALSLRSGDGLTRGSAEVSRTSGVEPSLVYFELEDYGSIEFRLPLVGGIQIPGVRVDVRSADGAASPRRVPLLHHGADGTISGRYRFARGGSYRWSFGLAGQDAGGEVEVVPGEVTIVDLSLDDVGPTFDSHVLIDATGVPGADPLSWRAFAVREDDPSSGFMLVPTRHESDPEGFWRMDLTSMIAGRWVVGLSPSADVVVEPKTVNIGPGEPPLTMIARRGSPRAKVAITVIDAVTGAPILGAEAAYLVSISDAGAFTLTSEGGIEPEALPVDTETTIIVRAAGYRTVAIHHQPSRDGLEVEARLERGWAERVVVIEPATMQLVEGVSVFVDGERVGATGSDGALMIQRDGPPDLVEVGTDDPSIHVQMSPFESGEPDQFMGYVFGIARR